VKIVAKYALPFNRNLWPGRTLSAESSSGAPRKIEGMKSTKVWVIAIAVIKIMIVKGEVMFRRAAEKPKRMTAMRFMWIPGMSPVIVPAMIPKRRARIM